jgi:hypothetical protein
MLIGLTGFAGSGKDSVAEFLSGHHGFTRVAFADPLKKTLYELNPYITDELRLQDFVDKRGWDEAKQIPEVRALLQRHGISMRNQLHTDIWVDAAFRVVDGLTRCVLSDTRFPNEYAAIEDRNGFIVRVVRPGVDAINEHISEHALDRFPVDAEIRNDGTLEELSDETERVMAELGIL